MINLLTGQTTAAKALKLYKVYCPVLSYESGSIEYYTFAVDTDHAVSKITKNSLLSVIWYGHDMPTLLALEVSDNPDFNKLRATVIP